MGQKRRTYDNLTDALRDAINESGMTFKAIERDTGVLRQSLMKFVRGETSLRLNLADKLAKFFGLQIVNERRKAK